MYRKEIPLVVLAQALRKPLVIAEGFKKERCSLRLWIANACSDAAEMNEEVVLLVPSALVDECKSAKPEARVLSAEDIDAVASLIIEKALRHAVSLLGGRNCGYCGYSSCMEAAKAWLRGEDVRCVRKEVRLTVDGAEIPLNSFVSALIESVVEAIVRTLKGVPKTPRRIEIVVGDEG